MVPDSEVGREASRIYTVFYIIERLVCTFCGRPRQTLAVNFAPVLTLGLSVGPWRCSESGRSVIDINARDHTPFENKNYVTTRQRTLWVPVKFFETRSS